ncbi:matrixin family metalloprotease [Catellatospora sp. IY07-71]|uniref:matrixin family metalloprotease n=1 Tax=Catellatospora sp. IY07-71 TaxID=2728827 RepID=UPI001BB3AAD9|nr:matrixin family metalloprotease [Catellatospora sp. IY07-71]
MSMLAATAAAVLTGQPAQAYCKISRWQYTTYTMHVRSSIPAGWQSAVSGAMHQWNGITNSSLALWGPIWNSGTANPEFVVDRVYFPSYGLPDVPGITLGPATSGTHTHAEVYLNTNFSWNTSGTMSQANRQVDVRTIAVHEIGHANGLHHPDACGAPDSAEIASVMYVNWTKKQNTTADDKAGMASHY